MEEIKSQQIHAIKKRLNDARNGKSIYEIYEGIKKGPDFFEFSYNTLSDTLCGTKNSLNLCVALATCRYLNLDISKVFARPTEEFKDLVNDSSSRGPFQVLDDPHYLGKFYGFYYTPHPNRTELIRFDLELQRDGDSTTATMTYYGQPVDVHQHTNLDVRVLHGIPYVDTLHSNIHIELTNEQGDYYFIYYNAQHLRSHDLYFRRGIVVTPSSVTSNLPISQSFVMFALKVEDSKLPIVRGLLADVSPNFQIPKSRFLQLCKDNPAIDKFYTTFQYLLEHDSPLTYSINESVILSIPQQEMNRLEVAEALLLLKGASSASIRQVYDDPDSYALLSRDVIQQSDKNDR